MSSDDVLERADAYREQFADRSDAMPLIQDLAAELREIRSLLSVSENARKAERNLRLSAEAECGARRKDSERLDWLLDLSKRTDIGVVIDTGGSLVRYAGSRYELDSAMAKEAGE